MTQTHDQIVELLGAFALDAVDAAERAEIEAHLPSCPRCSAEVSEHREVAAALANSGGSAPEGVWDRLVASLEEQPPAFRLPTAPSRPIDLAERRDRATGPAPSVRRPWLAAAAAVLVVVGVAVGGWRIGADRNAGSPVVAADSIETVAFEVLTDQEAQRLMMKSPDGNTQATVAIARDGSGFVFADSLPRLGHDRTYQLWGIGPSGVISLGVLGASPGVVAFHVDPGLETLAITSEVAGGVPASTNDPLLLGRLS